MPNIYVTFSATEAIECIPVQASAEVKNELAKPADVQTSLDQITSREAGKEFKVTTTQRGRRTR
jgi:hypothetical protein